MDYSTLCLSAILLVSLTVGEVSAIYCYQCNSHMEPECSSLQANDTGSRFYKECTHTEVSSGSELFCRKTTQLIYDTDVVHTRVIRSCGWVIYPTRECYLFKNKGHEDESCQCFTDGCNSAPRQSTASSFIAAVLLLLLLSSRVLSGLLSLPLRL